MSPREDVRIINVRLLTRAIIIIIALFCSVFTTRSFRITRIFSLDASYRIIQLDTTANHLHQGEECIFVYIPIKQILSSVCGYIKEMEGLTITRDFNDLKQQTHSHGVYVLLHSLKRYYNTPPQLKEQKSSGGDPCQEL